MTKRNQIQAYFQTEHC